jgi:hypothetical protein
MHTAPQLLRSKRCGLLRYEIFVAGRGRSIGLKDEVKMRAGLPLPPKSIEEFRGADGVMGRMRRSGKALTVPIAGNLRTVTERGHKVALTG